MYIFAAIAAGYLATEHFLHKKTVSVPFVANLSLIEGIQLLTKTPLSVTHLTTEKTTLYPPGTILHQSPAAGTVVRPHTSCMLTVAAESVFQKTPHLLNKTKKELEEIKEKTGLVLQIHKVPAQHNHRHCIGQSPLPGTPLSSTNTKIHAYIARPWEDA